MTPIGWQMLRLPMHPRYSRMLVEAGKYGCVPAAALCASLVSGRDLLMRLGRDDKHIAEARELFEASADSDFYTLMRAYQFARNNNFNVDSAGATASTRKSRGRCNRSTTKSCRRAGRGRARLTSEETAEQPSRRGKTRCCAASRRDSSTSFANGGTKALWNAI